MKAEYRRLGDYIRQVDVRNKTLELTSPMGVNIGKYFMPSVANTIGTDLSNYKVVSRLQFACNLMHVGRDEALPVAMMVKRTFWFRLLIMFLKSSTLRSYLPIS